LGPLDKASLHQDASEVFILMVFNVQEVSLQYDVTLWCAHVFTPSHLEYFDFSVYRKVVFVFSFIQQSRSLSRIVSFI